MTPDEIDIEITNLSTRARILELGIAEYLQITRDIGCAQLNIVRSVLDGCISMYEQRDELKKSLLVDLIL